MKVFRTVADSSCLIGLAQIELFALLRDLFLEVYIPQAVHEEVVVKGRGEPGSNETESAVKDGWISIKAINDEIAVDALRTRVSCPAVLASAYPGCYYATNAM